MLCTRARSSAPDRRQRHSPPSLRLDAIIEPGIAEYDQNSPEYIPVEELKAANDPRWISMVDGTWDSDEGEAEFRARTIGSIESIIERHPGQRVVAVAMVGSSTSISVTCSG